MMALIRKLIARIRNRKVKRPEIIPIEEKPIDDAGIQGQADVDGVAGETGPQPKPEPEPGPVEEPAEEILDQVPVKEKQLIEPIPVPEVKEPVIEPILIGEETGVGEAESEFKKGATVYPEGIKDYETQFDTTLTDSDGVKYNVEKVTSFPFPLAILKPEGLTDFFYPQEHPKSAICLHFTVGYLTGDLGTLIEQGSHISVPFVIGRNGTVYQLFNSKYWAYHLGRGAMGGNTVNSKRTIAIELSNIGPLIRHDGELRNIYGSKYCVVGEKSFYTKLDNAYRKYTYYSTFTEEQYDSLSKLISYLCSKHKIPREFLPEKRYSLFSDSNEAQTFEGICSHVNFRAYGKVDIGPAFEWDKITNV